MTSGARGYSVQSTIGIGYVRDPAGVDYHLRGKHYELKVATQRVASEIHGKPLCYTAMGRIRRQGSAFPPPWSSTSASTRATIAISWVAIGVLSQRRVLQPRCISTSHVRRRPARNP